MDHDQSPLDAERASDAAASDEESAEGMESSVPDASEPMLARVRYGLGKEIRLFAHDIAVVNVETADELRLRLASIRRLILAPGEQVPSKLVMMFDLDDGNTIIAAEGMSNVKDFRKLLARLIEMKPDLELDPPNMDEQLMQALDIRRRSLIGCYGSVVLACVVLWVIYMVVALLPHVASGGH